MRKYKKNFFGLLSWSVAVFCLAAAGGLTSCRPDGVLSSRQMRELIIDLHKTEALMDETGLSRYNSEVRSVYYAQVLEKHGTTQAQFDSSLVWYTAHPQLFDKIYPKVLKALEEEEKTFREAHPELAGDISSRQQDETPQQETRPFTTSDLDSVLWVTLHGYGSSWERWQRPFSMQDFIE